MRMKPMDKRILITKVVANTHERIARSGKFKVAFLRTGTWLPADGSGDSEVSLQGVNFTYKDIITPMALETQRKESEAQAAMEEAERQAAMKLIEEKEIALAERFAPAVKRSETVWACISSLVKEATKPHFNSIASYINGSFICAGSFPAAILASTWSTQSGDTEKLMLTFNDIDIYHGKFGDGDLIRSTCK